MRFMTPFRDMRSAAAASLTVSNLGMPIASNIFSSTREDTLPQSLPGFVRFCPRISGFFASLLFIYSEACGYPDRLCHAVGAGVRPFKVFFVLLLTAYSS